MALLNYFKQNSFRRWTSELKRRANSKGKNDILNLFSIQHTLGSRYRNKFRYRDPLFAIPYRNVLLFGTNCSDKEYTKCLCNILVIGTILSSNTEYVLLIRTICSNKEYGQLYSLSEQNHTPYQNKTVLLIGTICSNKEYSQPYSL